MSRQVLHMQAVATALLLISGTEREVYCMRANGEDVNLFHIISRLRLDRVSECS